MNMFGKVLMTGFFCFVVTAPFVVDAASLYIDPARPEIFRGDSITMAIRLDVDEAVGECVNAVDGVVTYSANIEPVDISIGSSIFSLWVEQPTINREDRTITFAGGIPNGYCGRVSGDPMLTNTITEIVFRSPGFMVGGGSDEPVAVVDFSDQTTAYLNSVDGRKADLDLYGSRITLNPKAGTEQRNDWQAAVDADTQAPEEFSIFLAQYPNGDYYVTFNTTDKQTGIAQYEVMEEPLSQLGTFQWGRADAPWIIPDHPNVHVLQDQSLSSVIRVKAVDKAGNTYIATLIPDESMQSMSRSEIVMYSFLAGVLFMAVLIGVSLRRWYNKRKFSQQDGEEDEEEFADEEDEEEHFEQKPEYEK